MPDGKNESGQAYHAQLPAFHAIVSAKMEGMQNTNRDLPLTRFWLFFLALLPALSCAAEARQDLEQIRRSAKEFVQQQLTRSNDTAELEIGRLESRMFLPKCSQLEGFLPANAQLAGKTRIGVRCLQPGEWSVVVPVTIRNTPSVVITARQIGTGQTITADDLQLKRLSAGETPAPAALTKLEQAIGKVPVTTLGQGLTLRNNMLRNPYIIHQNQQVTLVASGEGFSVSNEGKALGNAMEGQPVQVRSKSGQIIHGTAKAPGIVEVPH